MGSNCRSANCKMTKWKIVAICGTVLLIAAAVVVVVASRNRQQPAPPPDVPVAQTPADVRVKAVERNSAANVATAAPDVWPFFLAKRLDDSKGGVFFLQRHLELRPPQNKNNCPDNGEPL